MIKDFKEIEFTDILYVIEEVAAETRERKDDTENSPSFSGN